MFKILLIYFVGISMMIGLLIAFLPTRAKKQLSSTLTLWDRINGITPELKKYFQSLIAKKNQNGG